MGILLATGQAAGTILVVRPSEVLPVDGRLLADGSLRRIDVDGQEPSGRIRVGGGDRTSIWTGILLSIGLMLVAAFGFIPAVGGALLQELADLATILNALRALRPGSRRYEVRP